MDVNTLLLLVEVLDAGSLAAAARRTGVPKSTISRKLRELEDELGVRVLQRTTRQLGLTAAGTRLLAHARDIGATVQLARRDVRAKGDQPRGALRVTASVSLGERFLAPILLDFLGRHPAVDLSLRLDSTMADLIGDSIDVAIRIGDPDPKSPFIARRLGDAGTYPCASPGYLARVGAPEDVEQLRAHAAVMYSADGSVPPFVLEGDDGEVHRIRPHARLLVNSHPVAARAIAAGLGIGCLPAPYLRDGIARGELVRVLPGYRAPLKWIYALFPSRELPPAARAFVDFVADHFDVAEFLLDA
ncbi:MAG: LysR family transcriptional regulator [Sandaracinaceae bacterium]